MEKQCFFCAVLTEILNVVSTLILPFTELRVFRHILFTHLVLFQVEEWSANLWLERNKLELCEKEMRDYEAAVHTRSHKSVLRT
jgi:hypothetical protein